MFTASNCGGTDLMNRRAAQRAVEETTLTLTLPFLGNVVLPSLDHLAWYAGVAVLALAGIIEWPVAILLAAGKALADNRSHRALQQLGLAFEEAL